MKTRVYYGEYSLKHWIELMLEGNVELPAYQRSFVWTKTSVARLIRSLRTGMFVQPVTIARYKTKNGGDANIILDGQQRLTSVLLAYLGLFPNVAKFETVNCAPSGDDSAEDETDDESKKPIKWRYPELLKGDVERTRDGIRSKYGVTDLYDKVDFLSECPADFLQKTYLGFSYIVPVTTDETQIQAVFSQLFRNINYLGMPLSPLESRRSLYYMNKKYKNFFDGLCEDNSDALDGLSIYENMQANKIDILRYLSVLSQYYILPDKSKVMKGYSAFSSRESYYADYVSYLLGLEQEAHVEKFNMFQFDSVFPVDSIDVRFKKLRTYIQALRPQFELNSAGAFTTWIKADYWLCGLIYKVVFKGEEIADMEKLIADMKAELDIKRSDAYTKGPNRLGNLRERISCSIRIYESC